MREYLLERISVLRDIWNWRDVRSFHLYNHLGDHLCIGLKETKLMMKSRWTKLLAMAMEMKFLAMNQNLKKRTLTVMNQTLKENKFAVKIAVNDHKLKRRREKKLKLIAMLNQTLMKWTITVMNQTLKENKFAVSFSHWVHRHFLKTWYQFS